MRKKFDVKGKLEAIRFINDYEKGARLNGSYDSTMIKFFPLYLWTGHRDWYDNLCEPELNLSSRWKEVRVRFSRFFVGQNISEALRDDFSKLRQRDDESCHVFIRKAYRLSKSIDSHKLERAC